MCGCHSPFGGFSYSASLKIPQETICRLLDTGTAVLHVMRQQATVKYRPSFINKYVTMTWKCTRHLHFSCIHYKPRRPVAKLRVLKKVRQALYLSEKSRDFSICAKETSRLFEDVGGSWNLKLYRLFLRGFYGSRILHTPLMSTYSSGFPFRFTPNTKRDTQVFPSNLHKLLSV